MSGVAVGDVVDGADALKDLPTRTDDEWFFAVSFGFGGGKDRFEKKIKAAGPGDTQAAAN